MAITPDGKHAYVTNGEGTVSVITTATGAVSAPITVGKFPIGVAITPDGKHAYVTNDLSDTVSVITTATGAVAAPITVGKDPEVVAICPARAPTDPMMTVPAAVPTPTPAARQAQRPPLRSRRAPASWAAARSVRGPWVEAPKEPGPQAT